jgi:hypothetical protein
MKKFLTLAAVGLGLLIGGGTAQGIPYHIIVLTLMICRYHG